MTDLPFAQTDDVKRPASGDVFKLAAALLAAGLCYFALARLGLMLALINPSATPIWPATGFAVAVVLLWGYRLLPAIFAGAFAANLITAGSLLSSAVIALGNSLEAFIIVWMVNRWSERPRDLRAAVRSGQVRIDRADARYDGERHDRRRRARSRPALRP